MLRVTYNLDGASVAEKTVVEKLTDFSAPVDVPSRAKEIGKYADAEQVHWSVVWHDDCWSDESIIEIDSGVVIIELKARSR